MPRLRKLLNTFRFYRSEEGVTAIEFAFIAPVLLLFMFGTIEFSLVMFVQSVMEGATTLSSRLGKTGYTESGQSREDTIINALKARAGVFFDPSLITITSKFYGQFDQIGDSEPYTDTNHNGRYDTGETYSDVNGNGHWDADMGQQGYGDANDIVVYTVTYPWRINTPLISKFISNNGNVTLRAVAVVKNEPY
ncbi:MAG: TadE/TadG family type IV pilus assembly protein [Rickettsiales bacterium]